MPSVFDTLPDAKPQNPFDALPDVPQQDEEDRLAEEAVSRVFSAPRFAPSPFGGVVPPSAEELQQATKPAGMALTQAGKDVRDTAAAAMLAATEPFVPGGLAEAKQQLVAPEPEKPYALAEPMLSTPEKVAYKAASGLLESAPRIAAMAGMTVAGVPAPVAGGAAFGITEEGFSPKEAAIGAALPSLGKWSGELTGYVAGKLGVPENMLMNVFRSIGHLGGPISLLSADAAYAISQLPPEQRQEATMDAIAGQIGMLALALPGGLKELGTVRGERMLAKELGRVLKERVSNIPEMLPEPVLDAGVRAARAPTPERELGLRVMPIDQPFAPPGIQQLAGKAIEEQQQIVKPATAPAEVPAVEQLREAIEGPRPRLVPGEPVRLAEPRQIPGGGEAPYGRVSYQRPAEAPLPERTQAALRRESEGARGRISTPFDEANIETVTPEEARRVRHTDGMIYGAGLELDAVPRLEDAYRKASEDMRKAFQGGDQASQLNSFARVTFYGGALQGVTRGEHPVAAGNWNQFVTDLESRGLPVPGEEGIRGGVQTRFAFNPGKTVESAAGEISRVLDSEFADVRSGVEVASGISALPEKLQSELRATFAKPEDLIAFYDVGSKKVIFNANHPTFRSGNPQLVRDLMVHEVAIHKGLRLALGTERFNTLLDQVRKSLTEEEVGQLIKQGYQRERRILGEEWLAHAAERVAKSGVSDTLWSKVADTIRRVARDKFGINLRFSDTEIARMVSKGFEAVKQEGGEVKISPELTQRLRTYAEGATTKVGPDFRAMLTDTHQERLKKLIAQGDPNAKLFSDAMEWQRKIGENKLFWKLNPDKSWMEDNTEYWRSIDPDLLCQRSEGTDAAVNYLKEKLGDQYESSLGWEIIARAQAKGLRTPCPQCYVFSHRAANDLIQKKYVVGVGGYNGQVARQAESLLQSLLGRPLRHYSSTDFKAEHIPGLMVEFTDAEAAGIPVAAYSKQGALARIFGKAGMYINLSIGRDEFVGMNKAEAFKLRKENPNVATVYVSFTDAETLAALRNPQVDHVIPWHASAQKVAQLKATLAQLRTKLKASEIKDYTREQYETVGGKKSERQIKDYEHNGDLNTYLRLVEEAGVTKRFPGLFDQLSEAEKPLYMKLIGREYGKFGDTKPYQAPKAGLIDQSAIEPALKDRLATRLASAGEFVDIAKGIEKEIVDGTFVKGSVTPEIKSGPIMQGKQVFRKTKAEVERGIRGAIQPEEVDRDGVTRTQWEKGSGREQEELRRKADSISRSESRSFAIEAARDALENDLALSILVAEFLGSRMPHTSTDPLNLAYKEVRLDTATGSQKLRDFDSLKLIDRDLAGQIVDYFVHSRWSESDEPMWRALKRADRDITDSITDVTLTIKESATRILYDKLRREHGWSTDEINSGLRDPSEDNFRKRLYDADPVLGRFYDTLIKGQLQFEPFVEGVRGALRSKSEELMSPEALQSANRSARAAGAISGKAVTPRYVAETGRPGDMVLNFGSGVPNKEGVLPHSAMLESLGMRVTNHDIGANARFADPDALTRKYDTVFASNVFNKLPTREVAEQVMREVRDAVGPGGRAVFNFPSSPRDLPLSPLQLVEIAKKNFSDVRVVRGTLWKTGDPLVEARNPIAEGGVRGAVRPPIPGLEDVYKLFETPKKPGASIRERVISAAEAFRTGFSSQFRPLNKLSEDIAKAYGRTSPKDIAGIMEQLKGSSGRGEAQVYRFDRDVTSQVGNDVRDFNAYMFLRRTLDRLEQDVKDIQAALAGQNVPTLNRRSVGKYTIPEIQSKLQTLENSLPSEVLQRFRVAADRYQSYMDKALRLQVESGRMSPEVFNAIKAGNQFYAPFKVMKYIEETMRPEGTGRKVDTVADFTKAMEGIESTEALRLGDMLAAARQSILLSRTLADKANAVRQLTDLTKIDTRGDFIRKLAPNVDPPSGWAVVHGFENGKKTRYATRQEVADALATHGPAGQGMVTGILRAMAVAFKAGATMLNLPFQASNLLADVPRAALVSKYGVKGVNDLVTYPMDFLAAIYASMTGNFGLRNKLYMDFLESGTAGTTIQEYLTPEALRFRDPSTMSKAKRRALGILYAWPEFSTAIEQTSKVLGVRRAMRAHGAAGGLELAQRTPEAVTEIRRFSGSPDFGRMGSWVENYRLNLIYMFLNARIQGAVADLGRLTGRDGAKTAAITWGRLGVAIGVPTAMLYYFNHRTPEAEADYNQRTASEKSNYWLIPKDSFITLEDGRRVRDYWKVPKRESAKWVANLIESGMKFAKDRDPESFAKMGQTFVEDVFPVNITGETIPERVESTGASLHPLIKTSIELATGRDLYRHRDVVPETMRKASPELQFTEKTAEAFKTLSRWMPDVSPEFLRSPLRLENITRNMTAGLITQFLKGQDVEGRTDAENLALLQRFQATPYTDNEAFVTAMKEMEREGTDDYLTRSRAAKTLIKENPDASIGELFKLATPAGAAPDMKMFRTLMDLWMGERNGITSNEKRIAALPTPQRAKYLLHVFSTMTPEQKQTAIQDLARKRVLTEDVFIEMAKQTEK